jgi:DegV family protein with EDD domain
VTVRIVVDSTADIPRARAERLGIEVAPETVLFGDQAYLDGIDLDGPGFYRKLATSPVMPTTSAPAPGPFEDTYCRVIRDGASGILSLHIASSLNATCTAARAAAQVITAEHGVPVAVVDSGSVSAGFRLAAELVAQQAQESSNLSLADLKAYAEGLCQWTHLFAVLETLAFLQRGGRIGLARALMGTLRNMKPRLAVQAGQVVPLENVRTRTKAYDRLGERVAQLGSLEALAVVETDPAAAEQLNAVLRRSWSGAIEIFTLGPVVGTHAGPGATGVAAITQDPWSRWSHRRRV